MATKKERLETLKQELEQNTTLPLSQTANLVFGEGSEDAQVLFIGEAPGFHEDKQGRPFVGLAGQLLNKLLAEISWPRESVYITNIVKRRPPENRDPLPEEIEAYKPYLAHQIKILEPKLIATLGRFSMNYFLPEAKISRDHGRLMKAGMWFVYPLYHPAAALRATAVLEDLRKDFQRLPEIVERLSNPEIPQAIKEQKPGASQTSLF